MNDDSLERIPYRAVLKPNGIVEAYTAEGELSQEYSGPWSKDLQNKIQRKNRLTHLEGFDNVDSRMRGIAFKSGPTRSMIEGE